MNKIYHCFWIEAPVTKVHAAITDRAGLTGWWTEDVEHSGELGSVSTFRFSSGAFNKMKIVSRSQDRVEWECVGGHDEWLGTRILFHLRLDGKQTKLCFSHFGWKESTEYLGECSFHWAFYMVSLKKLCETGTGTPNRK